MKYRQNYVYNNALSHIWAERPVAPGLKGLGDRVSGRFGQVEDRRTGDRQVETAAAGGRGDPGRRKAGSLTYIGVPGDDAPEESHVVRGRGTIEVGVRAREPFLNDVGLQPAKQHLDDQRQSGQPVGVALGRGESYRSVGLSSESQP